MLKKSVTAAILILLSGCSNDLSMSLERHDLKEPYGSFTMHFKRNSKQAKTPPETVSNVCGSDLMKGHLLSVKPEKITGDLVYYRYECKTISIFDI